MIVTIEKVNKEEKGVLYVATCDKYPYLSGGGDTIEQANGVLLEAFKMVKQI